MKNKKIITQFDGVYMNADVWLNAFSLAIKADGEDLSYVTVELADANGIKNPKAENLIYFRN